MAVGATISVTADGPAVAMVVDTGVGVTASVVTTDDTADDTMAVDQGASVAAPAVTDDTTRPRKRRRHHVGPADAARRHQRIRLYGSPSSQPGRT